MTSFRPTRRELIRWAASASIVSGVPLFGCGGPSSLPAATPWTPKFLTAREADTLTALAGALLPGGPAGTAVFVDRLLTALDGAPALHAEGPYSGRQPYADGTFPAEDGFTTFAPLDRVNAEAWRLKLYGGQGPNAEAVTGLRDEVRGLLKHAQDTGTTLAGFQKLTEAERDLLLELLCQSAYAASEYGGNANQAGWKQIHFEGDSQPLGYSIWNEGTQTYDERPDFPVSTASPGADPDPLDATSKELIEQVVRALGGRIAS